MGSGHREYLVQPCGPGCHFLAEIDTTDAEEGTSFNDAVKTGLVEIAPQAGNIGDGPVNISVKVKHLDSLVKVSTMKSIP